MSTEATRGSIFPDFRSAMPGRRGAARALLPELAGVDAPACSRCAAFGEHGRKLAGVVGRRSGLGRGDPQTGDRRQVDP